MDNGDSDTGTRFEDQYKQNNQLFCLLVMLSSVWGCCLDQPLPNGTGSLCLAMKDGWYQPAKTNIQEIDDLIDLAARDPSELFLETGK